MGPRRRRLLRSSWAEIFHNDILPCLPVGELSRFLSPDQGRPSKELYTVLGTLILQQTFDLTDEETVDQIAFNLKWHYGLNITEESDAAKYICPRTLWGYRQKIAENGLDEILFENVTEKLARIYSLDPSRQRIDSVQVRSNMSRMGRVSLFVRTIQSFLANLKRDESPLYQALETDLVEKYMGKHAPQSFAMVKPSESKRTLEETANDLYGLVVRFKEVEDVTRMKSYKLMERVLSEQCRIREADHTVTVKPASEVRGDSLQNPSDPDATYSGHKGQGYRVQLMETYSDGESTENEVDLITHVAVESAHESDAHSLIPAIESAAEKDRKPDEVLADALYGSDENLQAAEAMGVSVVSPVKGEPKKDLFPLTEFSFTPKGDVARCPAGHAPYKTKKNKTRFSACFTECNDCPHLPNCPVVKGKKGRYLRYSKRDIRLAERRAHQQTEAFIRRYRYRAGIEGRISAFDRRCGIKRLRFRGKMKVKYCIMLKAAGFNILRAASARRGKSRPTGGYRPSISAFFRRIQIFKEFFEAVLLRNRFRGRFFQFRLNAA